MRVVVSKVTPAPRRQHRAGQYGFYTVCGLPMASMREVKSSSLQLCAVCNSRTRISWNVTKVEIQPMKFPTLALYRIVCNDGRLTMAMDWTTTLATIKYMNEPRMTRKPIAVIRWK